MSKVLVDEANLTAIGNAIRAKNENTTKYKPSEMANAISNIRTNIEYTTGDLQVVSPDNWSYNIVQTANQTISANPSAKIINHDDGTYSSALSFDVNISPNTGYVPGTIQKSADKANHVYTITATAAEEIAGMVENGYAKVYEDGKYFYSDDKYTDELSSLSGNILIAGMKNTDLSNMSPYRTPLYYNDNITKFKNTFITKMGDRFLQKCTSLTSVNFTNLTSAGDYLLGGCTSLQSVYLRSTTMCILSGYTGLPSTVSIYVPASLIDSYKTANYWKEYASNFKAL